MRSFILVFGWLALTAPLAAQDADQPAPETGGSAAEEAVETPRKPAGETPPSPDRFTPSEEISLDLPVSFPVDI